MKKSEQAIILFDGVCNLCNASVQFVLTRDKNDRFLFAALQSEKGRQLLTNHPAQHADSVVLIEGDTIYTESTAALRIAKHLSGGWFLLYPLIIVPPFIRNAIYRFIARYRYQWFGKKAQCMLPEPQWAHKFIDN